MECDWSIEKITAEVLEGLVVSACSKEKNCFLTCSDPGQPAQEKQAGSKTSTSKNSDSLAVFEPLTANSGRKTSLQNLADDAMRDEDDMTSQSSTAFCPLINILPDCAFQSCNQNEQLLLNSPKLFSGNCVSFDDCSSMIKSLLDTFDTFDKKDHVQTLNLQAEQEKVSSVNHSFTESITPRSAIHRRKPDRHNRLSLPTGNSKYCFDTKVACLPSADFSDFFNMSGENPQKNDNVFDNLDMEIDHVVQEIISNNADLLSCCQSKNSKSKSQSTLETPHLTVSKWSSSEPATPECSDNLAELKLHSDGMTTPQFDPLKSNGTKHSIPTGWLNTLTKRKERTRLPPLSRVRSRSDDFAYCGPHHQKSNCEKQLGGAITPCGSRLTLRQPEHATDIPSELLHSGIAKAPDARDKDGNTLLYILADDILWKQICVTSFSLANFLLYLTSKVEEVSLFLDCRNSIEAILNKLLEAFSIAQSNGQMQVKRIIFLSADESDDFSAFNSALKALFKCECTVSFSLDSLKAFVDSSDLLICYGGQLEFSQAEWAQNRLLVDSFVSFCQNIRRNFSREALSMTSQPLPETAKDTQALLKQHQREMTSLLDDRQVTNLHDRSRRILDLLAADGTRDAKSCTEQVHSSYTMANDAVTYFVRVADDRLMTLEHHLLVKQFEESCEYIHRWYTNNKKILHELFSSIPDSFEDLREQRAEFDAFYLDAMTEYAKCDCLLSEVEQLNHLGYFVETELTQRAKLTEDQVKELVIKMEEKKEEIEGSTHMYQFIDNAYSWALEGMKFVAVLNMNECSTPESCQKLLNQFDDYMKQHPAISESAFNEIQELCRRYENPKCLNQCEYAMQKCKETEDLFNKRRNLIAKLKTQFKSSGKKKLSFRLRGRDKSETIGKDRTPASPALSLSPTISRAVSLGDEDSVDNISLMSYGSSGFDDMSVHSFATSPSNGYSSRNEFNYAPKTYPKPARKLLKKSASMPSRHMLSEVQNSSHIHSKSGISLTIGSPVPAKEEVDESGKTKISLIIEELIATEKDYVKSLDYVIEHYFPEMCKLDIPQALRCKRNVIFGNIEKIAEFHSGYFLRDLENCDGNPLHVAKTFQAHKESFSLYALYSKNKPQSDQLLQEHGNEFFKTKQMELGDKMDLASYLLKPVQRMAKYALLLHAMSKQCKSEEERSLREAEELVKFQLRHGNDLLTMDSIRDCDVNLKEQGNLLRQEQFIIFSGRRKIIRRVFLFEELILFSKPIIVHGGHDVYQYKRSYKTAEIGMTENIGDSGFKFEIWFRRRRPHQSPQDTYILQSTNRAIKRVWVDEIRNLLWKQALQNKDYRKKEMTSMGVGSKPHLALALSSENRITDRSVVATPPSDRSIYAPKLPKGRTRVSIAVPSFEYLSQQSKRPHSTISTSSSTSSVGSGNNQSSCLVSSLALASYSVHGDVRSTNGFFPPMAYCDFHAIAEDLNEDCESLSDSESSVSTSRDDSSDVTCKSPGLSRQYVSTV